MSEGVSMVREGETNPTQTKANQTGVRDAARARPASQNPVHLHCGLATLPYPSPTLLNYL